MGKRLPIQIVDEEDQPIGAAPREEAWEKGLIHRVVRVMVENDKGEVLLQHRAPTKDIFPNCWDNSVAGHVDVGEDYDTAVAHEVREELGVQGLALIAVDTYQSNETIDGWHYNRFARFYKARSNDTPTHLEAGKIDGFRWFTIDEVKRLIREHPEQITDGLRQIFERYY